MKPILSVFPIVIALVIAVGFLFRWKKPLIFQSGISWITSSALVLSYFGSDTYVGQHPIAGEISHGVVSPVQSLGAASWKQSASQFPEVYSGSCWNKINGLVRWLPLQLVYAFHRSVTYTWLLSFCTSIMIERLMTTVNERYSHDTNLARLRDFVGFQTILIVAKR